MLCGERKRSGTVHTSGQVDPKLPSVAHADEARSAKGDDDFGLCQCAERFNKNQKQAGLSFDEAPAYLFWNCGRNRDPRLSVYPFGNRQHRRNAFDDYADAPLLFLCDV